MTGDLLRLMVEDAAALEKLVPTLSLLVEAAAGVTMVPMLMISSTEEAAICELLVLIVASETGGGWRVVGSDRNGGFAAETVQLSVMLTELDDDDGVGISCRVDVSCGSGNK